MQALDSTIANVALPHMQGDLSASRDQITWVLTSYIVASAIATAPVGWLASRFGRKNIALVSLAGFTITSMMCGAAQSLEQIILFRLLQGVFGARCRRSRSRSLLDLYPTVQARRDDGDLGHGRDGRPDPGAYARRLADRRAELALGVLRQRAVRHRLRAGRLAVPQGHAPRRHLALRLDGLCRPRPRARRLAADARPRHLAGLVRLPPRSSPRA